MNKESNFGCAPGVCWALTFIFAALKVFGAIEWSWWWVLSPLWIGAIILTLVYLFILAVMVVVIVLNELFR